MSNPYDVEPELDTWGDLKAEIKDWIQRVWDKICSK